MPPARVRVEDADGRLGSGQEGDLAACALAMLPVCFRLRSRRYF